MAATGVELLSMSLPEEPTINSHSNKPIQVEYYPGSESVQFQDLQVVPAYTEKGKDPEEGHEAKEAVVETGLDGFKVVYRQVTAGDPIEVGFDAAAHIARVDIIKAIGTEGVNKRPVRVCVYDIDDTTPGDDLTLDSQRLYGKGELPMHDLLLQVWTTNPDNPDITQLRRFSTMLIKSTAQMNNEGYTISGSVQGGTLPV